MPDVEMIPAEVNMGRIHRACTDLELTVLKGDAGDLCVLLFPHAFHFIAEDSKPFVGFSVFHRYLDVKHSDLVSRYVQKHNHDYYCPKLYTVVNDDGKILFQVSYSFGWDPGATDEQISAEIDVFFSSVLETFAAIENAFPDYWALSDSEGGQG